ncbi:MAG: SRPBCC domain-containing protein [Ferroplasma sp.]
MDFSGEFKVKREIGYVSEFLANIENILPCLLGIYDIEREKDQIKCKIKLDISAANISAMKSVTGKMAFKYIDSAEKLNITGSGRIAGSKINFAVDIEYKKEGDCTAINWFSSFDFGLIIKIMGKTKVEEISKLNINRTMECIINKLEN